MSDQPETIGGFRVLPAARPPEPPEGWDEHRVVDPFEAFCAPYYTRVLADGKRAFAFRVDERHVNLAGICHGGMLMSFADATLGATAWGACANAWCVTVSMNGAFQRPAHRGDLVEVSPQITRQTRTLVFVRGDFTVRGELVLGVTSLWKVVG